jgi:hypothetical protein
MWHTLITQRGEVSGLVRILHQRLGYHMTEVLYIYSTCVHLTLVWTIVIINSTDTTITLVQYNH